MQFKLHSNKKHRVLGYYFYLIRDLISSPHTPFDKLYYVDLYCGDGSCQLVDNCQEYDPPVIESLLKPAQRDKLTHPKKGNAFCVTCFLNDLDSAKRDSMKEKTKAYAEFVHCYSCEDANNCYKAALEMIPPEEFSIFYLDPTNHSDLNWDTIKGISEHSTTYSNGEIRRPELIINFMICTMTRSFMGKPVESITKSLGTDNWFEEIARLKKMNVSAPVENALLNTFVSQLKSLGYEVPPPIAITNTTNDATVYYLVWATNKKGCSIIETRLLPWMNKMLVEAQQENRDEIKRINAKKNGIASLSMWINE